MAITITSGDSAQRRLVTMRKGVVAAALAIDQKFRREYGEPVYRTDDRKALANMRNPFAADSAYRVAFITLTYSPAVAWESRHITTCLNLYSKWLKRRGHRLHYVWTVELQGNGRPHYHVIMWLPAGIRPPMPDKQGWWPHGQSNAKWAFSPVGYVAKYASKESTKSGHHLPKGARLWGHGGLTLVERGAVSYATAPRWLKSLVEPEGAPKRQLVTMEKVLSGDRGRWAPKVFETFRAWVVTAGAAKGWCFFGPYAFEGMGANGMALRHTGVIECRSPDGEMFFLPHKG